MWQFVIKNSAENCKFKFRIIKNKIIIKNISPCDLSFMHWVTDSLKPKATLGVLEVLVKNNVSKLAFS